MCVGLKPVWLSHSTTQDITSTHKPTLQSQMKLGVSLETKRERDKFSKENVSRCTKGMASGSLTVQICVRTITS